MTYPAVVGLDLSSTCAGICRADGSTDHLAVKGPLLARACAIRDWLSADCLAAELIVVEGIATQQVNTAISMGYVHCLVDMRLRAKRVVKVSPGVLKKFATGKGNADKTQMVLAAQKAGWDSRADSTHDEADAFFLHCLGRHMLGETVLPETEYRADAARKATAA